MAILSKGRKSDSFESNNSLKISFTNIQGICSNFAECESCLNQTLLTFLLYVRQIWMTQLILAIFCVRAYLPLIRKDSVTQIHDIAAYVKEGFPFAQDLTLENSADSYFYFTHCLTSFSSVDYLISLDA